MENKVYFSHMTTKDGRRFTIAGIFNIGPFDGITLGIGLCGKKEMFARRVGRMISLGRALAPKGTHGRINRSLYETTETQGYWVGQELKVFRDKIKVYSSMTADQLKEEFRLKR